MPAPTSPKPWSPPNSAADRAANRKRCGLARLCSIEAQNYASRPGTVRGPPSPGSLNSGRAADRSMPVGGHRTIRSPFQCRTTRVRAIRSRPRGHGSPPRRSVPVPREGAGRGPRDVDRRGPGCPVPHRAVDPSAHQRVRQPRSRPRPSPTRPRGNGSRTRPVHRRDRDPGPAATTDDGGDRRTRSPPGTDRHRDHPSVVGPMRLVASGAAPHRDGSARLRAPRLRHGRSGIPGAAAAGPSPALLGARRPHPDAHARHRGTGRRHQRSGGLRAPPSRPAPGDRFARSR